MPGIRGNVCRRWSAKVGGEPRAGIQLSLAGLCVEVVGFVTFHSTTNPAITSPTRPGHSIPRRLRVRLVGR